MLEELVLDGLACLRFHREATGRAWNDDIYFGAANLAVMAKVGWEPAM